MKKFFIKLSAQIAVLSLIFCVVVSSFMLVDFMRFNAVEAPAKSKLDELRTQITATPENVELQTLFGELELIYRRAYFVSDAQITSGASLLLFGFAAFLLSFALRAYLLQSLPKLPEKDTLKKEEKAEDIFIKTLSAAIALSLIASLGVIIKEAIPSGDSQSQEIHALYSTQAELDANWTGLRGARNDGIAKNFTLPEKPQISELWATNIDIEGFNSVVLFEDRAYISGMRDEARVVKAFDVNTGEELWEKIADKQVESAYDDQTGPAPSTMVCDAHRAYAIFPSGELFAYTKEGNLAWQKKFATPEINYGYASSLLLSENTIIVQMTLDESNVVYALEATSGKELWKSQNDVHSASWSSPTFIECDSKKIVIVMSSAEVVAIDFLSGEILWKNKCMSGEVAPSVTYKDGKLFVANEYVAAYAIDVLTGKTLWENSSAILPSIASVVVDEKALYFFSAGGTYTKLSIEDGKLVSESDLDNGIHSSPILIGNKLIICDIEGQMFISDENGKIEESIYDFEEAVNATPAFIGDKILLRLEEKILCLKLEEAQ
ncbi:MAG: PQQ-binding-like beta-propeller repeat protein [Opitutales bacterium]